MRPAVKHPGRGRVVLPAGRVAVIAVLALSVGACQDVFLTEPAADQSVQIDLGPMLSMVPAGVSIDEIIPNITGLTARVFDQASGRQLLNETVPLDLTVAEPEARFEIPLDRQSVEARGEFALLFQNEPLLAAREVIDPSTGAVSETFTLAQGVFTAIIPVPDPEVADVQVTPVPTITALGTEVLIDAQAFYATGDEIDDASFTYTLSSTGVLQPMGGPTSNRFQAVGEGTVNVTVTADPGSVEFDETNDSETVAVQVTPTAASLEAEPTSLNLAVEEMASVTVRARDANGNLLERDIDFSSSDEEVVEVTSVDGGQAEVTAVGPGMADVVAELGSLSLSIPVTVTELGTGDVQVTLTWNTTADLDLWVTDPFGERIWYVNRTSESGGMLDVDDTDGFGPENIFWPEGEAPAGTYLVQVNHFAGPVPTDWQVRVRTSSGEETYTGSTLVDDETDDVVTFTIEGESGGVGERTVTWDDLIQGSSYDSFERSGLIVGTLEPGVLLVVDDPSEGANALASCFEGTCPHSMRLTFTDPASGLMLRIVGDDEVSTQTATVMTSDGTFMSQLTTDGDFESPEMWDLSEFVDIQEIVIDWGDPAGMGLTAATFISNAPISVPAVPVGFVKGQRNQLSPGATLRGGGR
ncbi:MAG: hypothetical protein PVI57_07010 [Gemmatimonadota bacterium]|jgi:hypothetical protein